MGRIVFERTLISFDRTLYKNIIFWASKPKWLPFSCKLMKMNGIVIQSGLTYQSTWFFRKSLKMVTFIIVQVVLSVLLCHRSIGGLTLNFLKPFFSRQTTVVTTTSPGLFYAMEFNSNSFSHQHILKTGTKTFVKEWIKSVKCGENYVP